MKILFVTPSFKPAYVYGGPAVSVSELAESLSLIGHEVTVYTTTANGKEELNVQAGVPLEINGVKVYYFSRQTGDHTHVSIGLWRKLWSTVDSFEVVHLQSWWSLLVLGAAMICRIKRHRYIISPRGMLSSYSFKTQHSFPKQLIHRVVGASLLKRSYLHATTNLEWNDCLHVNRTWKGFVLPNIIRFPKNYEVEKLSVRENQSIVFGFLSRIDPKKGLELLFSALATVNFDFSLKIAGKGEEQYLQSLRELSFQLGLGEKIEWCGWMAGDEKFEFLKTIDVFVLTSHNENFANAVIEALVIGTPVFVSKGVGLADYVQENNLGWTCETSVSSITENLLRLFRERHIISSINKVAPPLIQKDFSKNSLALKYSEAYSNL